MTPPFRGCIALIVLLIATPAYAQTRAPERVGFSVGVGYVGSIGFHGGGFALGVRYLPIKNLALGFDAGYGVEGRSPDVQDRWWLMPTAALVLPICGMQLDLGAGLGFGATAGYTDFSHYVAAPFTPNWAFQLVPTARVHAMVTVPVGDGISGFVRLEAATLLLGGNEIGSRVGNSSPAIADTNWYGVMVGLDFRIA